MKAVVLCSALALSGTVFAADPIVGAWKLNVAQSKPAPARAFPTAATAAITLQGDTYEVSGTQTYADGRSISATFTVSTKGGALTLGEGFAAGSAGSMQRINERTVDFVQTRDGKPLLRVHLAISPDGKTMQRTLSGNDAQGKPFEVREVYDKQ